MYICERSERAQKIFAFSSNDSKTAISPNILLVLQLLCRYKWHAYIGLHVPTKLRKSIMGGGGGVAPSAPPPPPGYASENDPVHCGDLRNGSHWKTRRNITAFMPFIIKIQESRVTWSLKLQIQGHIVSPWGNHYTCTCVHLYSGNTRLTNFYSRARSPRDPPRHKSHTVIPFALIRHHACPSIHVSLLTPRRFYTLLM